jgi:hypothetical protein
MNDDLEKHNEDLNLKNNKLTWEHEKSQQVTTKHIFLVISVPSSVHLIQNMYTPADNQLAII